MIPVDHEEVIVLSEEPNAVFDDVGRPLTREEHALVDTIADRAFIESDPETQASLFAIGPRPLAQRLMKVLPQDNLVQVLNLLPADIGAVLATDSVPSG